MALSSEPAAVFVEQAVNLWIPFAFSSVTLGDAVGFFFTQCSSNKAGVIALSSGYLLLSVLMCRGVSVRLWREKNAVVLLNALAIPIGAVAPLSIAAILFFGPHYLQDATDHMCGVSLSVGLSYLAAVIWGLLIRQKRRRAFEQAKRAEA
jgi:hypothetical protein